MIKEKFFLTYYSVNLNSLYPQQLQKKHYLKIQIR